MTRRRVLLIHNEPGSIEVLKRIWTPHGYDVSVATDALQEMRLSKESQFVYADYGKAKIDNDLLKGD